MKIVSIPGDGIGPEILNSVMEVAQALNFPAEWCMKRAGAEYYAESGKLMEDDLVDELKEDCLALKGPTATPIGTGFRSINVQLRQTFSTYANLRPVKSLPGVPSRYSNVDLVIVRENSEDLYKGVENMLDEDTALSMKIITRKASMRIIRFAFEYARKNGRKKVTCVHKANIMKFSDGLFLDCFKTVAQDYPDISSNDVIIDAMCMKLVTKPEEYDVIVTENLYGDILSDLCAGLVGGLGFAPSCNIGDDVRIYEAVHGSAPDIAGKDLANPSALLLAFSMLMEDNGYADKAKILRSALEKTLIATPTADIGGSTGTRAFTNRLIQEVKHELH